MSWERRELGDLCEEITVGHVGSMATRYVPSGVPFLRSQNVQVGRLELSALKFIDQEFHDQLRKSQLRAGDLVIVRTGEPGKAAVVPQGLGDLNCADLVIARPKLDVSARFLSYAINETAQSFVKAHTVGAVQQHFNVTSAKKLTVLVPSISEQRAIAEILGALDDKIALNERICETSLALADCYSQAVCAGGSEGPIAAIAQLATEGQLEFGDGYRTKRAEHGQPGLPILRVAEVADGEIRPSFVDHVRDEFRAAMGRKTSQAGDVVLTTKGTVGRVAMVSADAPEFVYSPQVCYFRVKRDAQVSNIYLFHWMRGPEFWRQAAGMKGQTDMADYLSLGDIKSLRITLPSRASLAEFDRKCAPLHARSAAARGENRTLADLRDTLLPQLLSGKLQVRDAVRTVEEVA
ncbi:restriction endonuclease subunit S [Streptomyces sp. NPDC004237]|uniref:restriction endonuclease subunit S n=1 Tax=Streptomyces sp. NPDC004237 TaxID=3154455 RepID=UPI0033B5F539